MSTIPDTQNGGCPSMSGSLAGALDRVYTEMDAIRDRVDRIEMDETAEANAFHLLLVQIKDAFHRLLRRR
jgi:hypothetical protein